MTINADDQTIMRHLHKAADEKGMVVISAESSYCNWLVAPADATVEFLKHYPADDLIAKAEK